MNQSERRRMLIQSLLKEDPAYRDIRIPADTDGQRQLLRGLLNVRAPQPGREDFLQVQDAYLQQRAAEKGITDAAALAPIQPGLYLWQGDITTLRCDAIVNAAKDAGLNMKKLAADVKRKDVRAEVDADIAEGQRIGVQGTPYFLINNLVARGALSSDLFKEAINMALQAAPSGQK